MPYFGLLDAHKKELTVPDYYRLDAGEMLFKISPPELYEDHDHITIINTTKLQWTAKRTSTWGTVCWVAMFDEVDDPDYFTAVPIGPCPLGLGDQLVIIPGKLRMGVEFT